MAGEAIWQRPRFIRIICKDVVAAGAVLVGLPRADIVHEACKIVTVRSWCPQLIEASVLPKLPMTAKTGGDQIAVSPEEVHTVAHSAVAIGSECTVAMDDAI
jgi:hypothetical protein